MDQRVILAVDVTVPRLGVSWLYTETRRVDTYEPGADMGVISGAKVIQPCLTIPFFSGELLADVVSDAVALCLGAAALVGEEFFAERQVVVPLHVCEAAGFVEHDARCAELICDQPVDVCARSGSSSGPSFNFR